MANLPTELKYASTHVWLREEDDHLVIGVTDYAQELLGDLVYVELPEVGETIQPGARCAVVESVKSASDVILPIGGTVVEAHEELKQKPELINSEPYNAWLFKIKPGDLSWHAELLSAEAYQALLSQEN